MTAARWIGRALVGGLLALFAVNLSWTVHRWSELRPVAGGQAAPRFELPLLGGDRFLLRPGRPTVIDFWASWCAPCREELPSLDRLAARERDHADVVAVNIEAAEALPRVAAFVRGERLTLPVALDGNEVAERYHVENLPHVVVVDGRGMIQRVFIGAASERDLQSALDDARLR